ncbi:MAG: hypothetical protein IJ268_07765, partial [Proteobacteria bacterium]|nr:hypothetical protein [Pseudomonadota bacterium]
MPSRFSRRQKMVKVRLRDFLEGRKWSKSGFEIFSKAENGQSQASRFSRRQKMVKVGLRDFLEGRKWSKS